MIPKPYLYAILAVLLVASHGFVAYKAWDMASDKAEAKLTKAERDALQDAVAEARAETDKAKALNRDLLDRLASRPPSVHTKETIRANPSECRVPEPVARSLRELAQAQDASRASQPAK